MWRRWWIKIERAWCRLNHRPQGRPTNGLGWRGWWCPTCGYSHFSEWEDWVNDIKFPPTQT